MLFSFHVLCGHTRGWRHPNSANHSYALAHTASVPDLTDTTQSGEHLLHIYLEGAPIKGSPVPFAPSRWRGGGKSSDGSRGPC